MNERRSESSRHSRTLAYLPYAAIVIELAATIISIFACYRVVLERGHATPTATQLYAISLVMGLVGVLCAIPGRAYRLTVLALFLVTIAFGIFPAALPAILYSP
jgi:predicted membrane channel-forming protein YqfA (hemolysin III family)